MKSDVDFAIVTVAKNEGKNLCLLSKSISQQNIKPAIWVIIDDASQDNTKDVIAKIKQRLPFVDSYRVNHTHKYDINRYPFLVRMGLNKILSYSHAKIEYLAIVDSDVFLADNYFDEIISALKINERLGIACGVLVDKYMPPKNVWGDFVVAGAALVVKRKCYEDVGGFPPTPAMPDTLFITRVLKRGWSVRVIPTTKFIHLKPQSWKRYRKMGENQAWVGYHPLNALFTSLYYSQRSPYFGGIAYLAGYLYGFLSLRRIEDDQIFSHFRKESFQNFIRNLSKKIAFHSNDESAPIF